MLCCVVAESIIKMVTFFCAAGILAERRFAVTIASRRIKSPHQQRCCHQQASSFVYYYFGRISSGYVFGFTELHERAGFEDYI